MLLPFILFGTIGLFQSCDDLFHEDPPKVHVNKGEVGDQFTYLTHFVDQQCTFYGMKKTLYVKKGDPEPLIAFVYSKDKYGGVCKYTCKWDSISLRTLVDETKDKNKHWGALLLLVGGRINFVGEKAHIVTMTLFDKQDKIIVERTYEYKVVSTEDSITVQNQ